MHDVRDPALQRLAILTYDQLSVQNRLVLSAQCLTEFVNVATRKISPPLSTVEAAIQVGRFSTSAVVYPVDADVVRDAVHAMVTHQMSIWDALIWAVAFRNYVPTIVTEDAQSRPIIEGVRYISPFDPDFDLESL
jgi:predicted nucleic acid-binding protein